MIVRSFLLNLLDSLRDIEIIDYLINKNKVTHIKI